MEEKETGVIMTIMKLKAQFALVYRALAGARICRGTISAGWSQVMTSHPTAKNVLNMKRKAATTIRGAVPPTLVMTTRMIMEASMK